jgi:rhodanese-related sulfurtransferase
MSEGFVMYGLNIRKLGRAVFQAAALALLGLGIGMLVNRFHPEGIPLVADWSPEARLRDASGGTMVLPIEKAVEFYEAREAFFVDARPAHEYAEGHVPGALCVPWQEVDEYLDALLEKVPDTNAILVVYCDGEACALSEDLAVFLKDMGYVNVKVLVNGWTEWRTRGWPVERGAAEGKGA